MTAHVAKLKKTSSLSSPRFVAGTTLQADDLTAIVRHTNDLSRLLFRTLLGCGVMCGLEVTPEDKCGRLTISIGRGVALDCCGNPIEVPEKQTLQVGDCDDKLEGPYWVLLKRYEKGCAPRASVCGEDEDGEAPSVCTRIQEGYEIRIMQGAAPDCVCGCAIPATENAARELRCDEEVNVQTADTTGPGCACVNPKDPCYAAHYLGECGCGCCDCEWIVLARVCHNEKYSAWLAQHRFRRFIRPVLMVDPMIAKDQETFKNLSPAVAAAEAPMQILKKK